MLASQYRLRKKNDFAKVAKYGRKKHSAFFICYEYRSNQLQKFPRFGIVISQKISKKATIRNKLRRWIKSDLYKKKKLVPPHDYMILVKKEAVLKTHAELTMDLNRLCSKK